MSLGPLVLALVPQVAELPPRAVELRVERGRAVCAGADSSRVIMASSGLVELTGRTHLELGGGAEVQVVFPGRASLRVLGPASLEWGATPPVGSREPLTWNFFRGAEINLEVRRHGVELELPNDWQLRLEGGALRLASTIDGAFVLTNDAGPVATATYLGGDARPPVDVRAGASSRLGPIDELPTPPDLTAHARPWSGMHWPWPIERIRWGTPEDASHDLSVSVTPQQPELVVRPLEELRALESPVADLAPTRDPSPADPSDPESPRDARVPGHAFVSVPSGVGFVPVALPRSLFVRPRPDAEPARAAVAPGSEDPAPVETVEPEPTPTPAYTPEHWHSVPFDELMVLDGFAYQARPELEIMELLGDRQRLSLSATAPGNVWVFGATQDALLLPGAVLIVSGDGTFGSHYGRLELSERVPERPDHQALERGE